MATWYISDGDLPFLNEFPEMKEVDDAPLSFWKIINGNLPFRNFAPMHIIDDAPLAFWRIIDGDLPFRIQFPEMPSLMPDHVDAVLPEAGQLRSHAVWQCLVVQRS